jgi:hypothetical protein
MRQHNEGQSLVEMALLLPLLLIVLFGIIEFGYLLYGYATIYQAARNGAEIASGAPPFPSSLQPTPDESDPCVASILDAVEQETVMFDDLREDVTITYPNYVVDPRTGDPLAESQRRRVGYPIEVTISHDIEPLTPLWDLLPIVGQPGADGDRVFNVTTTARRSIESYGRDPTSNDLSPCLE